MQILHRGIFMPAFDRILQLARMEEMDCEFVEVTAHEGARPTPAEIAAYKALTAYAPDTVVQVSDGAGVKLEYQRDVNIAIKNLEDAIASMTTT